MALFRRDTRLLLFFALALALVGALGVLSYRSTVAAGEDVRWVTHTHQVIEDLVDLGSTIKEVEGAARGYVITGREPYLEPYHEAASRLEVRIDELTATLTDTPSQSARLEQARALIMQRLAISAEAIAIRREQGAAAAAQFVMSDKGRVAMQRALAALDEMEAVERRLLATRSREADTSQTRARRVTVVGGATALLALALAFVALWRDLSSARKTEVAVRRLNDDLARRVDDVQRRGEQIALLSEMGMYLHSSQGPLEVGDVLRQLMPRLLPGCTGAVYLFRASRDLLELASHWTAAAAPVSSFAPTECWALRLGHPHLAPDGAHGQRCSHAPHGATTALCVPLVTSGECMGLLQLQGLTLEREGGIGPVVERLIQAAAGQVGLALLNLSLRERLRAQSIRDPLTGLFNRRFFEETFEAELARAGRNGTSLALLMVDVDFFKRLNDTFGHLAGDATLKELGALFRTSVRAGDVACRLGGEEFALLMPDIDASVVRQRANALRASVERLLVEYHAEVVGPVTVSVGIARFPDHGRDAVALLREADAALYRAKAEGRNRVCEAAGPSA